MIEQDQFTSLDSHSFISASKGTTKGDPFIVNVFTIWSSSNTCQTYMTVLKTQTNAKHFGCVGLDQGELYKTPRCTDQDCGRHMARLLLRLIREFKQTTRTTANAKAMRTPPNQRFSEQCTCVINIQPFLCRPYHKNNAK